MHLVALLKKALWNVCTLTILLKDTPIKREINKLSYKHKIINVKHLINANIKCSPFGLDFQNSQSQPSKILINQNKNWSPFAHILIWL